jgi:methylmalonyl-CoA/ethylmalonyl-CoA epimerase
MRIIGIHHLTVAVRDVERARAGFEALFGASAGPVNAVEQFGVRTRDLALGNSTLQLASPLAFDNPVTRFIERKGEGFYNLALEVDDLDAAVAELRGKGARISDPVEAEPGIRSAFLSMAATHGLSIQLVQLAKDVARPAEPPMPEQATEIPDDAKAPAVETATPEQQLLDLTPDEWSDTD